MKKLLMIAVVFGALVAMGSTTAQADCHHGWGGGYYGGGYGGYYGGGYPAYGGSYYRGGYYGSGYYGGGYSYPAYRPNPGYGGYYGGYPAGYGSYYGSGFGVSIVRPGFSIGVGGYGW